MVPTIKEILNDWLDWDTFFKENPKIAKGVEIAMLSACLQHREECLKQAAAKAKKSFVEDKNTKGGGYYVVNNDSILNAYSKKNIR